MVVNSASSGWPAIHAATSGDGRALMIADRMLVSRTNINRTGHQSNRGVAIRQTRRQLEIVRATKGLEAGADALIEIAHR